MKRVAAAVAGVAVAVGALLPIQSAVAAEDVPISNTLPEFVSGPTPFEVKIAVGNPPICRMTYGDAVRETSPWTFTFNPSNRVSMIRIATCAGSEFNYYLSPLPELAYFASRNDEVREAGYTSKMFIVNNAGLPGKARVLDSSGKVLSSVDIAGRSTALSVVLPKISGRYAELQIVMASNDGNYTIKQSLPISRGWARIMNPLPVLPCSTVYWRYQSSGAPRGVKATKLDSDFVTAMARLSQASGITFNKATDNIQMLAAKQSITFGWRAMLGTGVAVGDPNVSKDGLGYRTKGQVWLNALNEGALDRFAGSAPGNKGANPGRVWPITRAILQVMGLESTQEKGNLMYPVTLGPSGLGAGDRFALNQLFTPNICR